MSAVGADPATLDELRRTLLDQRRTLAAADEAVADALWRLAHGSTVPTPAPDALAVGAGSIADALLTTARDVGAIANALRDADRHVVQRVALGGVELWGRAGDVRTSVDAGHDVWRYGRAAVRQRAALRLRDVAGLRTVGAPTGQRVAALVDDVVVAAGRASGAGDDAVLAGRAAGLLGSGRLASITRLGGRALGAAAVGLSVHRAWTGFRDGDEEEGWLGVGGAAAGIALASGVAPLALAGAVVTAGLLVYEHRAALRQWGRRGSDGLAAARDGLLRALGGG